VFIDPNGNGTRDAGETAGVAGVWITVMGPGGATQSAQSIAPDGWYQFASLAPGSYTVIETQPAGYASTSPDVVFGVLVEIGARARVDFGEQLVAPTSTATATATATATGVATSTPTPTEVATSTSTPTATATATVPPTATATPTATVTRTPTATITPTTTPTITATWTPTPTASPTVTPTPTPHRRYFPLVMR
jgi:cell division septation protein DedD